MRRLVIVALTLSALALGEPADALQVADPVHWPQGRAVVVLDGVIGTIHSKGVRRLYRLRRGQVLAAYAGAGLTFAVHRVDGRRCPAAIDDPTNAVARGVRAGAILLCRNTDDLGWAKYLPDPSNSYIERAVAVLPPWSQLVLCHEVGHTLGLNHPFDPATGDYLATDSCMAYGSSASLPNAEDIRALAT